MSSFASATASFAAATANCENLAILLGAAGAIECIVTAKTIEEGYIHRTRGLHESEEELDLDYCKEPYEQEVDCAISNSLGFGGHNACILLQKYKEQ